MKTILVATDFSKAALNASRYAADMALTINANLRLLFVYQSQVAFAEIPLGYTKKSIEEAKSKIDKLKYELLLRTKGKLHIETEMRAGKFLPELEAVCENIKPYTVVMGSQGTAPSKRFLFGSHTVNAMKQLAWPLISVPSGTAYSSVQKIGLAFDFDNVINTIPLDEIKAMVNDFKAKLYVLNIGKKEIFNDEIIFESNRLQQKLAPVKPNVNFIINSDTNEGIMHFAGEHNLNLLIVLPKKHNWVDRLVNKSHTKELVLRSNVPVMSVH